MGYLGTKPSNSPLTSELIPNSIITNAKINDVAATKLTGVVPDANAPSGSIIQTVQVVKTDTFSTLSTSFVDVTGLSASITPISASSKILVLFDIALGGGVAGDNYQLAMLRNSSFIYSPSPVGSRSQGLNVFEGGVSSGMTYVLWRVPAIFLDSPSTTSSVTYKAQVKTVNGLASAFINRSENYSNSSAQPSTSSSITLLEIAA